MADGQQLKYSLELSIAEAKKQVLELPKLVRGQLQVIEQEISRSMAKGFRAGQKIKLSVDSKDSTAALDAMLADVKQIETVFGKIGTKGGGSALKDFRREVASIKNELKDARFDAGLFGPTDVSGLRAKVALLREIAVEQSKVAAAERAWGNAIRDRDAAAAKAAKDQADAAQKVIDKAAARDRAIADKAKAKADKEAAKHQPIVIDVDVNAEKAARRLANLADKAKSMAFRQTDPDRESALMEFSRRVAGANPTTATADSAERALAKTLNHWKELDKATKDAAKPPKIDVDTRAAETKLRNLRQELQALAAGQSDPGRASQASLLAQKAELSPRTLQDYGQLKAEMKAMTAEWRNIDKETGKAANTAQRYKAAVADGLDDLGAASKSLGGNDRLDKLTAKLQLDPGSVSNSAKGVRKAVENEIRRARAEVNIGVQIDDASAFGKQAAERIAGKQGQNGRLFDPSKDKEALQQLKDNYAALERDLSDIRMRSANQAIATTRKEVAERVAAYKQAQGAILTSQLVTDTGRAKQAGKHNTAFSSLFQIQQAVEDFSFAGIRGAGNNIAMLMSQMGAFGAVGLAAITGITVAWLAMDATIEDSTDSVKRAADEMGRMAKYRDSVFKAATGKPEFSKVQNIKDKGALEFYRSEQTFLSENLRLLEQLKTYREQANTSMFANLGTTEDMTGMPTQFAKLIQDVNKTVTELEQRGIEGVSKFRIKGWDDLFRLMKDGGLTELLQEAENALGNATGEADRLRASLDAAFSQQKSTEAIDGFNKSLEKMAEGFEKVKEIPQGGVAQQALGQLTEEYTKRFEEWSESVTKALEESVAEIDNQIGVLLARKGRPNTTQDERKSIDAEIARLNERKAALEARAKQIAQQQFDQDMKLLNAERERLAVLGQIQESMEKTERSLEKQRDALQDIIQKEAQRQQQLRQKKSDTQDDFVGKKADAEEQAKNADLNKAMEKDLEGAEKAIKAGSIKKFGKMKGINPVWDQMREDWEQQQQQWLEERRKKWRDLIEKETKQNAEAARNKKRSQIDKRLEEVGPASFKAEAEGEIEKAQDLEEKRRELLKKKQDLALDKAAEGGPGAAAAAAEADALQAKIDQSFERSEQLSKQVQENAKRDLQTINEALEKVKAAKESVATVDMVKEKDLETLQKMKAELAAMAQLAAQVAQALQIQGNPGGKDVPFFEPRAAGGPVTAGNPYLVGEKGPEFFIPGNSGVIMNATQTSGLLASANAVLRNSGNYSNSTTNTKTTNVGAVVINNLALGQNEQDVQHYLKQVEKSDRIRKGR